MDHNTQLLNDLEFVKKYSDEITNLLIHKHNNSDTLIAELFSIMQRLDDADPNEGVGLIRKIVSETRA